MMLRQLHRKKEAGALERTTLNLAEEEASGVLGKLKYLTLKAACDVAATCCIVCKVCKKGSGH